MNKQNNKKTGVQNIKQTLNKCSDLVTYYNERKLKLDNSINTLQGIINNDLTGHFDYINGVIRDLLKNKNISAIEKKKLENCSKDIQKKTLEISRLKEELKRSRPFNLSFTRTPGKRIPTIQEKTLVTPPYKSKRGQLLKELKKKSPYSN